MASPVLPSTSISTSLVTTPLSLSAAASSNKSASELLSDAPTSDDRDKITGTREARSPRPKMEFDIFRDGNEQEIAEAIDKLTTGEQPWKARRALKIWRQLADTLPDEYNASRQNGEQKCVNTVLQPFLSVTFSSRGTKVLSGNIEHESANEHKDNHTQGVRSDFFVVVPVRRLAQPGSSCVGLVEEVQPPKKVNSAFQELKDHWKFFRMMKSEINFQIKGGIKEPVGVGLPNLWL
ncbi:hypothetical protein FBU30_002929 [Linnemannia zychae]|nr:hypothetical protein FBU30_002929 [Linnemannia zychae]